MTFEEFSPAAIACAIGWMAAGADRQLRGDYFTRWAVAALVEGKFTFEFLTDFETEIRRRYESAGLAHLAPSLATFAAQGERNQVAKRLLQAACKHPRLDEDGICHQCGADRRGI